ncbi:rhodanese-like domain-containing protein [Arcanobacterium hippocoleae]|uniref:Rhodanese-related sulfurtransferase n=1 Tax=Arcanobacterium hippocoleae TaxID=149017 RepID=A0ABU1T2M6_9ACTO|nr:rhodanese-like domain-containing protein [Arcanobacterium hippocoleae]MDR6939621.1 rhodanese-related sulfurtransferase [Arcanobacterium hippocoleae]
MLNYLKIHAKNNPQQETAKKSDHRLETEAASDELKTGYSANTAPILLDVRTPAEFSDGHLAGAINIDFTAPDFLQKLQNFDPHAHYILYCRSGGRASAALSQMTQLGFQNLSNAHGYSQASQDLQIPIVK